MLGGAGTVGSHFLRRSADRLAGAEKVRESYPAEELRRGVRIMGRFSEFSR